MNKNKQYIELSSQKELIEKLIDIFSTVWLNKSKWLTDKEKEYFIHCVFLNAKGWSLSSKETREYFKEHPDFPKKSTYIYTDRLKKKKWIIVKDDVIVIHPDFDYKDRKMPTKIIVEIPLKIKENQI